VDLGPGSFRVIGLFESQMQASTVILTNESGTPTVQIPSIAHVKVEPLHDNVFVLSDSEDNICASVDLSNTLSFPFRSVYSIHSKLPIHASKSPCGPTHKSVVPQILPSQRPPLHPSPSSTWLTMVDALKLTKSRKKSKSDLASIDFDSIDVRDVKYLPSSFNGDVLFLLPPVALKIPSTYSRSMDGMDKMYDGHPWCTTKITNIQNDFELSFRRSTCAGHLQCHNDYCDYMNRNGASGITLNGPVQLLSHLLWVTFLLLGPLLSVRYVVPHLCALVCVMLKSFTSTPHPLECPELAFILVYMITLWPMAHAVSHWTWHTSALQMKY
jgi:hypothetical protein